MNLRHHRNMTFERWSQFGLPKQILMIANELNRAKNAIKSGNASDARLCYERAAELAWITIAVYADRSRNRLHELLRFREVLNELSVLPTPDLRRNQMLLRCLVALHPQSLIPITD